MQDEARTHRVSRREWLVRNESKLVVKCGWLIEPVPEEEDCISMESISESRLEHAPEVGVNADYPHLRGAELLCGHRFAAVNLLWSWVISKMSCPVCRAEFPANAALPAALSEFTGPTVELRALQEKISNLKREEEREAEMEVHWYVLLGNTGMSSISSDDEWLDGWFCDRCGREFATERALEQHQEATGHVNVSFSLDGPSDDESYQNWCCDQCSKEFATERALEQHQRDTGHVDIGSSW